MKKNQAENQELSPTAQRFRVFLAIAYEGNSSECAQDMGVSRQALWNMMKRGNMSQEAAKKLWTLGCSTNWLFHNSGVFYSETAAGIKLRDRAKNTNTFDTHYQLIQEGVQAKQVREEGGTLIFKDKEIPLDQDFLQLEILHDTKSIHHIVRDIHTMILSTKSGKKSKPKAEASQ